MSIALGNASKNLQTFSKSFEAVITNGVFYVKCYRDLNRNGQYDSCSDVLIVRQVGIAYNGKDYALTIGDGDGDSVLDYDEQVHGSIPTDANNYCFNLNEWPR